MIHPMTGTMAIKCQIIFALVDPKSFRIISIKASMVRPKDMAVMSMTYIRVWSMENALTL